MRLAVVTAVAGRHEHLLRQHSSLANGSRQPDLVVVSAMGDEEVAVVVGDGPLATVTSVLNVPRNLDEGLPLAAARNVAVEQAWSMGAELVVLLDVDCLSAPDLLERYEAATEILGRRAGQQEEVPLLCSSVAYLPPPANKQAGYAEHELADASPHPARPSPAPGELQPLTDWRLFWSLSFALTQATWEAIGGFDESYRGYGAEDTDFGQRARAADVHGWWLGALALHQWHPVSDPPVEHLDDILRNAHLFRERWGWFPMEGWLTEFEEMGLVERTETGWGPVS